MLRSGRSAHNTPWKPTSRRRTYWQNILANVHPAVRPTDDDVLQVLNGFLFKSRALQAFQGPPASTLEADETDVPKPVSLIGMLSMEVLDTMAAAQAAEERAAKFKKAAHWLHPEVQHCNISSDTHIHVFKSYTIV